MEVMLLQIPPFRVHCSLPHSNLVIKVLTSNSTNGATNPGHSITPMLCFVTQQAERKHHLFDNNTVPG
jgi:hypothetical protein